VLIIHAIQDLLAPIEGGANSMSIAELAEMWRSHGRCDGTSVDGLVASVHLNSGGTEYGEWTLGQVDRLIDERDPMITKAVSWSLRQMIKHQASDVETYVDSRADRMAALPRREVRNKLNTGRKSGRAD